MSQSVINTSQNAPFYTNFLKIFWESKPPDPLDSLRASGARHPGSTALSPSFYFSKLNMSVAYIVDINETLDKFEKLAKLDRYS